MIESVTQTISDARGREGQPPIFISQFMMCARTHNHMYVDDFDHWRACTRRRRTRAARTDTKGVGLIPKNMGLRPGPYQIRWWLYHHLGFVKVRQNSKKRFKKMVCFCPGFLIGYTSEIAFVHYQIQNNLHLQLTLSSYLASSSAYVVCESCRLMLNNFDFCRNLPRSPVQAPCIIFCLSSPASTWGDTEGGLIWIMAAFVE